MLEQHKGRDDLAPEFIRSTNHPGFGDGGMSQEGTLDFDRTKAMARDLNDLIRPSREPDVTIFVNMGRVTGVIDIRDFLPIITPVSLWLPSVTV